MAGLFQQKITRWILKGKRVKPHTPGAKKVTEVSPTWSVSWTDPDTGLERRIPVSKFKSEAIDRLKEIEADLVRRRLGLPGPAPRLDQRPLTEHLEEYCGILKAKGDVLTHVDAVRNHCNWFFQELEWGKLADVKPEGVLELLAAMRADQEAELPEGLEVYTLAEAALALGVKEASVGASIRRQRLVATKNAAGQVLLARDQVDQLLKTKNRGKSASTSNHYLRSIKSFATWCFERDRLPRDPLVSLAAINAALDPRRRRRALSAQEFSKLIDYLEQAPKVRGLAGPDRLALYLVASGTGFRAHECFTLTPESFQVGAPPYGVKLPATASKRRRDDRLPLRADLAELLREYLKGKPAGMPIWPGLWYRKGGDMMRGDLEAAGIPYLERGKVFDFHALRGQLATALAAAGIHPRVAQALLRLSSVGLAMKHYTDAEGLDPAAALERLPPVRGTAAQPAAQPPDPQ